MNGSLMGSLQDAQRTGAEAFGATMLAEDSSRVIRRVGRRRAVRAVGTGTVAASVAGGAVFGVANWVGAAQVINPMLPPSADASPTEAFVQMEQFTVVSGARIDVVFEELSAVTGLSIASFEAAEDAIVRDHMHEATSLEGWILSGEHQIPTGASSEEILNALLVDTIAETEKRTSLWLYDTDQDWDEYLSKEVMTTASLIEQEVPDMQSYADVAGVIQNRLDADMPLQLESTVDYAHWPETSSTFTIGGQNNIDSPYNTYKYRGLPPGPIGAPSVEAIAAALSPAEHDYLYFMPINLDTWELRFATSYEEHLANVDLLLAWQKENQA